MVRKASCCCGDSFVEVAGEPTLNAICHCDNCKQRTGSAFGWSTYFSDAQVLRIQGDLTKYKVRDEQVRSFCSRCGTTLFWTSAFRPSQLGVAGGTFLDPPLQAPVLSSAHQKHLEWVSLPANIFKVP